MIGCTILSQLTSGHSPTGKVINAAGRLLLHLLATEVSFAV